VKVRFWGTRGSVASPGPDTVHYGGNTSCVELRGPGGELVVFDAGTGIRGLGLALEQEHVPRVDVLLSHLHLDHVVGLGFFSPLYWAGCEVHLWGPASVTMSLRERLTRYLSPPLFPVRLRDLPCDLHLHEVPAVPPDGRGHELQSFAIGGLQIAAQFVMHPGPTVGFRVTASTGTLAYMPDHEPALGVPDFPRGPRWTSGHDVAEGVDLLIHDGQYCPHEYEDRVGWGHSTLAHSIAFARQAAVKRLVVFHHDPVRSDAALTAEVARVVAETAPSFPVIAAYEGQELTVGAGAGART
jgi:phosphoribosyl 1,2-cyclic phosphodiesterase